jgi:hypothetical protein
MSTKIFCEVDRLLNFLYNASMEKQTVIKEIREKYVGFYVSDKMHAALQKAADLERRTISSYLRVLLERLLLSAK